MNTIPSLKLEEARSEASVREALDAVDRSEVKHRVLIAAVILGVIPVALWLDAALWKSPATNNAINIRTVAVIVAMLTVATMKIRAFS
jgi:hypothetical protein